MANPSSGHSLLHGSELHPHSLIHRHYHNLGIHSHRHYHRIGRRQTHSSGGHENDVELALAPAVEQSSPSDQPFNDVDASESSVDRSTPTKVGQNASPSSDSTSALYPRNVIGLPEPLLAGSLLGNPVAIPVPDLQAPVAGTAPALDPDSRDATPSPAGPPLTVATTEASTTAAPETVPHSATGSTATEPSSSSQASELTSDYSSSPSIYSTVGDLHSGNNTFLNGNSSFFPASSTSSKPATIVLSLQSSKSSPSSVPSNSSWLETATPSFPTTLSLISSTSEQVSSTAFSTTATHSDISSAASSSTSTPASIHSQTEQTTTTLYGGAAAAPAPKESHIPTSSSIPNADGTYHQHEQVKRIVGGVCGSVAGVAFLAVLVLLALKYKRRRDSGALLGTGQVGSTASRFLTGKNSMAMAEGSGTSAAPAPFSNLSGKRSSHQASGSAEEGGERGFYRVAGRKLPPVLITGGDGYSDPRESVASGGSDYYRGSQAFDATAERGPCQLALGAPMRPVSGVPMLRSGPVRTPVTENPFIDPLSPPTAQDTPSRRPVSRASASKFHEGL